MPTLKLVQELAIHIEQEDSKLQLEKNKPLQKLIEKKFTNRIEI